MLELLKRAADAETDGHAVGEGFALGPLESDALLGRKPHEETPEFDITAMVDLVFMMNIYFLVTFITVALAEINLPTASHVRAARRRRRRWWSRVLGTPRRQEA